MLFYIVMNNHGELNFSPVPAVDKLLKGAVRYLSPGLPLEFLERYFGKEDNSSENHIRQEIILALKKDGSVITGQPKWLDIDGNSPYYEDCLKTLKEKDMLPRLLIMTKGRQLSEGECSLLAKALGLSSIEVLIILHKAVVLKNGEWVPCLYRGKNTWRCERCGDDHCEVWPSQYGDTATCLGCKSIGALTSLQVLFRQKLQAENTILTVDLVKEDWPGLDWQFTNAQSHAAQELMNYSRSREVNETLVWAACGAGKTEITFPLIREYLQEGKSVLFAAPRQDVVHDIQPRLQRHFSPYKVKILSGAVQPDWAGSLLTVATTHQVLRFYRSFHLVIFDEIDAYPYAGNKVLEYGMRKATKENGKIIYLTATPSNVILEKVARQECRLIRLPARFHGYLVPVPEILKIKLQANVSGQDLLRHNSLSAICEALRELALIGQLIVFVPTVALVTEWVKVLKLILRDKKIEGSWSSDPERKRKVSAFSSGNCDILVCTSILERGVTIHGVQVAVLYADHKLYDVRSLVQMAGRTGRTAACPSGRTIFLARSKTRAMKTAINWINEQNTLAISGGFIHG